MANPTESRVRLARRWFPERAALADAPARPGSTGGPGTLSLVVLGQSAELAALLEQALWTWPHRIRHVKRVAEAVDTLQGGLPSALVVPADETAARTGRGLRRLRDRFPALPLIVIGSATDRPLARRFVANGASAFLERDQLGGGGLYDLLASLTATLRAGGDSLVQEPAQIELPYRDSTHIGVLLANAGATIVDANALLLGWFGLARADALRGKNLCWAFGVARSQWDDWRRRLDGPRAVLHDAVELVSVAGARQPVDVELFRHPQDATLVQLNCFARRD